MENSHQKGEKMAVDLIYFLFSRLRLHEAKVIKDRRHHLRTYPNCFVAKEIIDWLIEHKETSDRDTAIKIMQKLLDQSILHHGGFVHHILCLNSYIYIPLYSRDCSPKIEHSVIIYSCHSKPV